MQQGDVDLFQTNDGGDVYVEGGLVRMSGGLSTMVYLSLFGGNEDDSGRRSDPHTWWGNIGEIDPGRRYRSETQHLLQSLPATSSNLRRIEKAAGRDLSSLVSGGVASAVQVAASIPALNRVRLNIVISAEGLESEFQYSENWKASP